MAKSDLGPGRGWMWLVIFLVTMGGAEALVVVLITHRLLPVAWAIAVDALVLNWTAVAIYAFASPLWGAVEIDQTSLVVRFGMVGVVRAPVEAIGEARVFTAPPRAPLQLGAGFDQDSGRINLVRSTTSQNVIVTFGIPVTGRVRLYKPVLASSMVLTTSDAATLAAEINAIVRAKAADRPAGL